MWLLLMEDLAGRGFMETYGEELECMMYDWGFSLSIRMMMQKGYILTVEELELLKKMLIKMFPGVLRNTYVAAKMDEWDKIMKYVLAAELTDEVVEGINRLLVNNLRMTG